jgi:cyclopropane-fatty-acyl-phospholipid synthase
MQNTNIFSATKTEAGTTSIFQKFILGLLSDMKEGHLVMTLPDGQVLHVGDPASPHRARLRVVNPAFFRKCIMYGDIGFGESYVDGDWETDDITGVISWFLLNLEKTPTLSGSRKKVLGANLLKIVNRLSHLARENSLKGSKKNIHEHYDLSNDFFRTFLDPTMTYSSAYFKSPGLSLEEAQHAKYDRLCRKLNIGPDDHVLEIGTGWGGFAIHAAKNYGCRMTTITISENQYRLAKQRVQEERLNHRVDVQLRDYRAVDGEFDKIVSIEMLEAVGDKYFESYFAACARSLKRGGVLGLQVIISPDARYDEMRKGVDWIQKHVFPGTLLPSIGRLNRAIHATSDLFLYDLKDLGMDYARTLRVWRDTMNREKLKIRDLGFDDRFLRKWNYYFSYCEAAFAMRNISVVQMICAPPGKRVL